MSSVATKGAEAELCEDRRHLGKVTVDFPPAQDELGLLVADLLETFQVFQWACVENVQDPLSPLFQHRRVQHRLPSSRHHVLFTVRRLMSKDTFTGERFSTPLTACVWMFLTRECRDRDSTIVNRPRTSLVGVLYERLNCNLLDYLFIKPLINQIKS